MSTYTCDKCRDHEAIERLRSNTIPGLLKRLGHAIAALFRKPKLEPALPRFYCVICREFVDPKLIIPRGVNGFGDGAVNETFLGYEYEVTCHGDTSTQRVTLVSELVGGFCHHDAFRPAREGPAYTWEEPPELRERRLAEVAFHQRRLQAEIASANATRAEWLAKNAILSKLTELQQLVQSLAIVLPQYEKPGVITEAAEERIDSERVDSLRHKAGEPYAPGI